jgi:hypothetical protein
MNYRRIVLGLVLVNAVAVGARAAVLATESFALPVAPGLASGAPYLDMMLNTTGGETTWGEKGAVGLQGAQSGNLSTNVTPPAADVAMKFNIGATVDSLNSTYGAGNWAIANPKISFQYTYYANNGIFGGGAGSFETYWVANDNWAFGNGASAGNSFGSNEYVAGTDPVFAADATALTAWAGTAVDLGATTYNWLSPANNPNYAGWSTDKAGANQGILTVNLPTDSTLIGDMMSATAGSNPNVSFYMIPNDNTLGLTIFTGGGSSEPTLTFDVVSVPEPASLGVCGLAGIVLMRRRR